jgi:spore coat protein JB
MDLNDGCRELLLRIQELSFVAVELNLYLDTHPDDTRALEHYNRVTKELDVLRDQYNKTYGPLTNFGYAVNTGKTWRWIEQPWPWDM